MALTAYSFCPCGSGKKFRFCCQPIHEKINKAFRQDANKQYEAALRTMNEVTQEHPDNPEAWGRKAQLLFQMDKATEAKDALDKAFQLNPQYPFGHYLEGRFRQYDNNVAGALEKFRLAAEYYHPEARDTLSGIYSIIADFELALRRPVAARAALDIGRRLNPNQVDIAEALDRLFGENSPFPASVCKVHSLEALEETAPADLKKNWKRALASAETGKLSDAERAFQKLAQTYPEHPPSWHNLGVVQAWLGKNSQALESLDRYVALEPDETKCADTWELAEVLRFGQGMEDHADYVNHHHVIALKDVEPFIRLLEKLENEKRFLGGQLSHETGQLHGIILEKVESLIAGQSPSKPPRRGANLVMFENVVRLSHVNAEAVQKIVDEISEQLGDAIAEVKTMRGNAGFLDVISDGLVFPTYAETQEEAKAITTKHVQEYFEEAWLHRPLRSLSGVPPIDAVGSFSLRKKLLGVIQFLENTLAEDEFTYSFDRLRRKVGLIGDDGEAASKEINDLGATELAQLNPDDLDWHEAEKAFQTALKIDAKDLASRFAENLVARPLDDERTDRFPLYRHLVQTSADDGDTEKAIGYLDDGERFDCEHNEGRRRNDYEFRRGQLYAKSGDVQKAEEVFQCLFERDPDNWERRGSAIESLLSAKQSAVAERMADGGLEIARRQNNGDAEQYFMDLKAAAEKQAAK